MKNLYCEMFPHQFFIVRPVFMGGFEDARARASAAFDELDDESDKVKERAKLGPKFEPKKDDADRLRDADNDARAGAKAPIDKAMGRMSDFDIPKPAAQESRNALPQIPANLNVNDAARRLPDEITGKARINNPSLARRVADSMANGNLVRAIYEAVYGNAPAKVEASLATYDIGKEYSNGPDGTMVTYTLKPNVKLRLIQDFVKQAG